MLRVGSMPMPPGVAHRLALRAAAEAPAQETGSPPRPSRPIRQAMSRSTSRPARRGRTQPRACIASARSPQIGRWVDTERLDDPSAASAPRCLGHVIEKAPLAFPHGLTDPGNVFTDRFIASGSRQPTGHHPLDPLGYTHAARHAIRCKRADVHRRG